MYLITTKNVFSTKIIIDSLKEICPEHHISLLGPKCITVVFTPPGLSYLLNNTLKTHATKILYKHKVGKSTRYCKILL